MIYYNYHIPERRKIGTTFDLQKRMKKHNWKGSYEILDEHTCPIKAGDRELELQELYGYKKDNKHYTHWLNIAHLGAEASPLTKEDRSKGALISNHKKRSMNFDTAEEIRKLYQTGNYSYSHLAKQFNTTRGIISAIINRRTYLCP